MIYHNNTNWILLQLNLYYEQMFKSTRNVTLSPFMQEFSIFLLSVLFQSFNKLIPLNKLKPGLKLNDISRQRFVYIVLLFASCIKNCEHVKQTVLCHSYSGHFLSLRWPGCHQCNYVRDSLWRYNCINCRWAILTLQDWEETLYTLNNHAQAHIHNWAESLSGFPLDRQSS